jgi:hypothetical protein
MCPSHHQRWVAAGVVKREHCTPEAMQANDGKWAQVDVEARKAAAIAADIAVAEANGGGAAMSKKVCLCVGMCVSIEFL